MNEDTEIDDPIYQIINGFKHMAVDHPCCKEFIYDAIKEIEALYNACKSNGVKI